jgi:hypothetical protein
MPAAGMLPTVRYTKAENCALMAQDDGSHILVWNRDDRKQD